MEAVPRMPMISFDLKISPENAPFSSKLKDYIAVFYHEDPEHYNIEIRNLETLRASAIRPVIDVTGCKTLKQYFCQLQFLQSRFPMEKGDPAAITFIWRDVYAGSGMVCSSADIRFEIVSILYNIGAIHTQLGANESRTNSDGMKMACTHFQCAAWAFQYLRQTYPQPAGVDISPEMMLYMQYLSLAQAQECILEKSMLDNRKATIIAKVAVQVVHYYTQALDSLSSGGDEGSISETIGSRIYKDWSKYIRTKIAYHNCVSFLYHGQQAEEQQKMGERVAFYQCAFEELEKAKKLSKGLDNIQAINEAITFTMDVVEGKRKAAKNENEFIYHEEVPERNVLQLVKGASLVKGIPFSFNDPEVSGPDIFAKLVPMQAHEASSIYSEEKAQLLRRITNLVEEKDAKLVSYMNSLQLEPIRQVLQVMSGTKMTDLPQELVDRAAALSARPEATKDLVQAMATLANTYHDVESMLEEVNHYLKEEESREKEYQSEVGTRPPSMVATELKREAGKYSEAHSKASDSNQTLHRAMTLHVNNLKLLALPLSELRQHVPTIKLPDPLINETAFKDLNTLLNKVEEMRQQRMTLVSQLREAVCKDDVTKLIVTKPADQPLDALFEKEMQKHQHLVKLIEQNLTAQDNILDALTDAYARHTASRKAVADMLKQRETTVGALCSSFDAYDDLLAKANKGIEFYRKLESNVTKLLQRVKSTCKVQDEERESIMAKNKPQPSKETKVEPTVPQSSGPKLKDYLASMKRNDPQPSTSYYTPPYGQPTVPTQAYYDPNVAQTGETASQNIPSIRPAPVGSEGNDTSTVLMDGTAKPIGNKSTYQQHSAYTPSAQYSYNTTVNYSSSTAQAYDRQTYTSSASTYPYPYDAQQTYSNYVPQPTSQPISATEQYTEKNLSERMAALMNKNTPMSQQNVSGVQQPYNYPANQEPLYTSTYSGITNSVPSGSYDQNNAMYAASQNYDYPTQNLSTATNQSYSYPNTYSQTPATYADTYAQVPASYTTPDTYSQNAYPAVQLTKYPQATGHTSGHQHQTSYTGEVYSPTTASYAPNMYQHSTTNNYPDNAYSQTQTNYQYDTQNYPQQQYSTVQSYPQPNVANTGYPSMQTGYVVLEPKPSQTNYQQENYNQQQPQVGYVEPSPDSFSQQPGPSTQVSNYYGHPGYSFDPNTGQYQYTSGFQNSGSQSCYSTQQYYGADYQSVNNPGQYTSAGTNGTVYTNSQKQNVENGTDEGQNNYYAHQYGVHDYQAPSTAVTAVNGSTQQMQSPMTYTQSNNSNTSVTNSSSDQHLSSSGQDEAKEQSNVDLLAGLDFTISQAPLIPQSNEKRETSAVEKERIKIVDAVIKEDSKKKDINEVPEVNLAEEYKILKPPEKIVVKKDILADPELLNQFTQEVEKFEKFVEGLTNKTLNGPTPLDLKWKELQDLQDRDSLNYNISVARCYPMKNRFPDILPFDHTRVELPSTKDDYINASHIQNINQHTPYFIMTQAPLPSTYEDFWTMVWEQQSEVIVCLLNDSELRGHIYWPQEKGQEHGISMGKMKITLQSVNVKPNWIERIISVCIQKVTRCIVHLQFTSWPGSSFPASPGPLLAFVCEVLGYHHQQRSKNHPLIVHCEAGIGRSGLFIVLSAMVSQPAPLPDIVTLVAQIAQKRKQPLRDREHLKFAYQAVLYHAQDLLMQRGILTSRSSFEESTRIKTHTRHPSQDLLLGPSQLSQLHTERPASQQSNESLASGNLSRRSSTLSLSSGRCSPTDQRIKGKKSFSSDAFGKQEGLSKLLDSSDDPLNSLDPMWTIKKE